jgi:serine/threonine protein kinase
LSDEPETFAGNPQAGADGADDAPLLPVELGPFRLDTVLGRGGMGEVFLAWDSRLERQVAIKKIRKEAALNAVNRERLHREARAGARLSHPSIVHVFEIVELDGCDWIVMELVDGPTVGQLTRQGPLDIRRALKIAVQVAEGLAEAHGKGVLHRDLKPENVMISSGGRAKILDFGLAKGLENLGAGEAAAREETLTLLGEVMGTCRSMSPEQAKGLDLDGRSDLFSLGILLYEMATGIAPFRAPSAMGSLNLVCTHRQPSARTLNPAVPKVVADYVDRLMSKDREHRPGSAAQVVADLQEILEAIESGREAQEIDLPVASESPWRREAPEPPTLRALAARPPSGPEPSSGAETLPWPVRQPAAALLIVLLSIAVLLLAAYLLQDG